MISYFHHIIEYLRRIMLRLNTAAGCIIGVIVAAIGVVANLTADCVLRILATVLVVTALEAGYGVF
ncbi:MAG: hypothetical protein IIC24_03740, partial [Chloroflexi bacterium]|nr:hypothetical protein [Chloroflexota bacterium]